MLLNKETKPDIQNRNLTIRCRLLSSLSQPFFFRRVGSLVPSAEDSIGVY